jgi:hypothetical protein
MDKSSTVAIGNFLQFYHSDLEFIINFQKFKINSKDHEQYLMNNQGTFKRFINEFKVARNFKKEYTSTHLTLTEKWVKRSDCNDVDGFAKHLKIKNITEGSLLFSLASKILFPNNPWVILPYDFRTKHAVG